MGFITMEQRLLALDRYRDGTYILKAGPVVPSDAMRRWVENAPRFGYPPMGAGHRTYEQQLALYKKYMPNMVELPTKPPPRNWKPLIYTTIFVVLFILLTLMWYHIAKGQPGAG